MSEDLPNPAASEAPGASTAGQSRPSPGSPALGGTGAMSLEMVKDLQVPVSIELGRTRMSVADIIGLGKGSVVQLDRLVGQPVDVLVSDAPFATGEVVVIGDKFGVRILRLKDSDIKSADPS